MEPILVNADCLKALKAMPDNYIDCCITSPPYWGLRDYGTATWEGGSKECDHKAAKLKSRYDYSLASSPIQDGTRTGTDAPRWMDTCPTCGAKKKDLQLGLENTYQEYIDKLCTIFDEVRRVMKDTGTCWVNLGDSYTSEKCLAQVPSRFAIEMVNRGWILRNELIWFKPNCMPSSVKDRFTVDFEKMFFFVKDKKYWFETQYEPMAQSTIERAKRPYYGGKTKQGQYAINATSVQEQFNKIVEQGITTRIKRSVWVITTKPFKGAHFAVFPPELVETPIKAGCPEFICKKCGKPRERIYETNNPSKDSMEWDAMRESGAPDSIQTRQCVKSLHRNEGGVYSSAQDKGYSDCGCNAGFEPGIVLDIFCGSGTTGVVAKKLNRQFVGIELKPEYMEIAKKRINDTNIS